MITITYLIGDFYLLNNISSPCPPILGVKCEKYSKSKVE